MGDLFRKGVEAWNDLNKRQRSSDGGLSVGVGQVLKQTETQTQEPAPEIKGTDTPKPQEDILRLPLSFESKVKDGAVWADSLRALIRASAIPDVQLADASDWCPNYNSLPREYKVEFWAHFWAITMKYECDYNPKCYSVDVGNKNDRDTWSVGLLQMSVCDQPNYGFKLGYDFEDLQDPIKNMILAIKIAEKLILADRRICGQVDGHWKSLARYWGTLREGRKPYTGIKNYIANLKFLPNTVEKPVEQVKKQIKLGVVVGHDRFSKGAQMISPFRSYEYDFNTDIAHFMFEHASKRGVDLEIFFRDQIGVSGAYRLARAASCDAVVELHFNAFNGSVQGTETMCSSEEADVRLANIVQAAMVRVFKRSGKTNRGVIIRNSGRASENLLSYPGKANCLVEPAFGDNFDDAKMLTEMRPQYAACLVDAMIDYLT